MNQRIALAAVLAAIVFLTGYVLARRGRPYGRFLPTIHKVAALGSVLLLAWALTAGPATLVWRWPAPALTVVTAASVVVLFGSGAVLSGERAPAPGWVRIHRIVPFLALAGGIALVLARPGS